MQQKQVVIVNDGVFDARHYDSYIEILRRNLTGYKKSPDPGRSDVEPQQVATVEVVATHDLAEERVRAGRADIIIFISVGMFLVGQQFREKFPKLTVYVLAGKAVPQEPFLIPKMVLSSKEAIQQLLEV
ncbi:MAG: hypothetical protein AAB880_02060 [Patescibacteria group bacterium]